MKNFIFSISLIFTFSLATFSQIPTDGLVGYWSFTGNANDESGNGNNGTVYGATLTEDRFGMLNSAYSFDGVDDYINIPHSSSISVSSYVSISAWVKMDAADSGIVIVKGNYGQLWDYGLSTDWSYTSYPESGGPFVINEYRGLNDKFNEWHHFAVTVDEVNGNVLKMYFDGAEMTGLLSRINDQSNTSGNYIRPTSGTLKIGGVPEAPRTFLGLVDDVRIYNRTLSASEIEIIYNAEKPAQESTADSLIAYYPFNGDADDESGNGLHGTVNGPVLTDDRFGNANSAYLFDGSDDFIEVLPSAVLDNAIAHDFSISVWSYSNFLDGKDRIINISNKTDNVNYDLSINAEEQITFLNWGGSGISMSAPDSTPLHQWINTVITVNSNTGIVKMYIDGSFVTADTTLNYTIPSQPFITIGKTTFPSDWVFDGVLDDIKLFNVVLSDEEINLLFNEGLCFETVFDTITTEVFDTTFVTIYDTIPVYDSIAVTDTLVIDAVLTGIDPPNNINTLKIYPNPAKDHIYINTGDYAKMHGYQLKIINQLGATVFETNVEEPLYEVNLSTWSGTGLYFVQVIDPVGNIIDIRKIVLQ